MAEKTKRPVGEDMGSKTGVVERYSRIISGVRAAAEGRKKAMVANVGVLDEIPNKWLPSHVCEFLYGARTDRKKVEKLDSALKSGDDIKITADSVELVSDRSKRKPLENVPDNKAKRIERNKENPVHGVA